MACHQSSLSCQCRNQPGIYRPYVDQPNLHNPGPCPDQSTLYNHCANGTLTADLLRRYLASNPHTSLNAPIGDRRLTPLAIACEGGHAHIVLLLLEHKADPDAVSARRRPPLFYATTRAPRNRVEIVRYLLRNGAAIDKRFPEDHDATAIMNAITEVRDKAVVRALAEGGASLCAENASGQSVRELAREYGMEQELWPAPRTQAGSSNAEPGTQCSTLTNFVIALVLLVARHVDDESIRDIVTGAAQNLITGTSNATQLTVSHVQPRSHKFDSSRLYYIKGDL